MFIVTSLSFILEVCFVKVSLCSQANVEFSIQLKQMSKPQERSCPGLLNAAGTGRSSMPGWEGNFEKDAQGMYTLGLGRKTEVCV